MGVGFRGSGGQSGVRNRCQGSAITLLRWWRAGFGWRGEDKAVTDQGEASLRKFGLE